MILILKGIDISEHNGEINWDKTKRKIDFAMIRLGYGTSNYTDKCAFYNMESCTKNNIPFGVYWFSYAANTNEAIKEAEHAVSKVKGYKLELPIAFDFEYDSERYLKEYEGISLNNVKRAEIATAFCSRIKALGYKPMLYTNYDYYFNKGFNRVKDISLWFALWGDEPPPVPWEIWQSKDNGIIDGISGFVDINYIDTSPEKTVDYTDILNNVKNKYTTIANDIISGKYGNGKNRVKAMREKGYDYDIAQAFVNNILGY